MLSACTLLVWSKHDGTTRLRCNHHLSCTKEGLLRCSGCGTPICTGHWQHHFETCNWLAQGKYVSPDFTPPQLRVQDSKLPSALWRDIICTGITKQSRCGKRYTKKITRANCPSCTAQAQLHGSKRGPKPPRTGPHWGTAVHKQAAQGTYVPASTDWLQGRHGRTA